MLFVQHDGYCILLLTSQPVFATYITQHRSCFTHIFFFLCRHNIQSTVLNPECVAELFKIEFLPPPCHLHDQAGLERAAGG